MSITVYPYKLTQRELEARLEPGLTVLPGQYLRFATAEPIFGQVREVHALPSSSPGLLGGYQLTIALLYGTPGMHPQQAILMNAAQMGHEVQRLQEPIAQPLQLSPDFNAELSRLGPLTVIGGDDFVQKYEALQLLMQAIQPYRRIVILDPLGIFAAEDGYAYWQAGRDVRLSVQSVGSKSFLDTFGELFAPGLREAALRVVADHLPPMHEFMGFQGLLEWYSALNVPLKNLILQNCQAVNRSHVFADTPEQALDWSRTAQQAVTVLNLSGLSEPWRGLFYREAVQTLLEQSGDDVVPVLIYPENYLPSLSQWIQKADEAEFKLLMLASPYVNDDLLEMANNRFWVETPGKVSVMGSLTLGLPLTLPVPSTLVNPEDDEANARPEARKIPTPLPPAAEKPSPGFSAFNAPLMESEGDAPAERAALEPMDAADVPTHWLGEAAEPSHAREAIQESQAVTEPQRLDHSEITPQLESIGPEAIQSSPEPHPATEAPVLEQPIRSVVDLAAPPPEAAPTFLTASQLSDLLATGTPKANTESSLPSQQAMPNASAFPENSVPQSPSVKPPMAVSSEAEVAYVPEFASPPAPETWAPEPVAKTPAVPPFPTPEEYEKDEFHFDLNPDSSGSWQDEPRTTPEISQNYQTPTPHTEPDRVSKSLDEFATLDLPVSDSLLAFSAEEFSESAQANEPFFDSNIAADDFTAGANQPAAYSADDFNQSPMATPADTDKETQEALDLIFPNQYESSPAVVAIPEPDEPMAIIQKSVEPLEVDAAGFHAGDRVTHPTYGLGVIQKVIPMEESVVLNITFDAVGKRLLDPSLCTLTREPVA